MNGGARPLCAFTSIARHFSHCISKFATLQYVYAANGSYLYPYSICRYFNAMHESGPQSSSRLELPSTTELASWLDQRGPLERPALASVPFVCADNLGFYLFLKYVKPRVYWQIARYLEDNARVSCVWWLGGTT